MGRQTVNSLKYIHGALEEKSKAEGEQGAGGEGGACLIGSQASLTVRLTTK